MPHYRCSSCRTRRRFPEISADEVGPLCPDCGTLLEPVSELRRLVGSRAADGGGQAASPSHQAVIARIEDLLARRAKVRELDRRQAQSAGAADGEPQAAPAEVAVAFPAVAQ